MKLSAIAILGLAFPLAAGSKPANEEAPHGRYLEARTASVFAGPCHYNAELTTAGREALAAWSFEGGSWNGVPLAGSRAVAAIVGDLNLDLAGARPSSVLFLDAPAGAEQRAALRELLARRYARVLGDLVDVRNASIELAFPADGYRLALGEAVALEGVAMPDRACCSMPSSVWYAPLVGDDAPVGPEGCVVGNSREFRYDDARARGADAPAWERAGRATSPHWRHRGANDAFVGPFRME